MRALVVVIVVSVAAGASVGLAAIPGGGNPATDCHAECSAPGLRLDYPPFDPARPKARKVPAKVCSNDTNIACTVDAECGIGTCVPGVGGGVTASVAVAPDGETVYMASVDCYTAPSIGNSESIFSLDAASGAENWVYRTQATEQFSDGPPYHDYGFLNGPLWFDQIGASWGSMAVANGVLFVGTNTSAEFYAYAANSGTRLATFGVPNIVTSGASVVDGSVYVGYGFVGPGGGAAFALP